MAYTKEQRKAYREENKEKLAAQRKVYREENKEKLAAQRKVYRSDKRIKEKRAAFERERYKNDPDFKMKEILRGRLRLALKGNLKAATTMELIGCTVKELWLHIEGLFEPGMTRENNGNGEGFWHLDHKIPCCSFDFSDPEQQKICFHYTNLQPLWCKDNLAKGAKYNDI